ncbi:MAG: cyclic nucleotide-binding domain-containing protein, partial [Pseudomonadota bacterium]
REDRLEEMISPAVLIHLGAVLYIIGFLVRDELILRLLVLLGTVLYILYYFLFPEMPLWDAIITSSVLGVANLWVLFKIMFERTTFALSEEERELYQYFDTLNPGQFRRVLRSAIWHSATGGELLCIEADKASRLYFVMDGTVEIEKNGKTFPVEGKKFIGEIAFVLEGEYTATVKAKRGLRYAEWSASELRKLMKKNQPINNAVTALFNRDLASKLALSHQ